MAIKKVRVTKSPFASEAMTTTKEADARYLMAAMRQETFGATRMVEVNCYFDSKILKDHLESSNIISELRLRLDMVHLQEMAELK